MSILGKKIASSTGISAGSVHTKAAFKQKQQRL